MFAALVSGGVVTDAIVCDEAPDGWIASEDRIGVGWTYADGVFSAPAGPSDAERLALWRAGRQIPRLELGMGMKLAGILSQAETVQFVAYTLPAPILGMIAALPSEYQDDATLVLAGARDFPRSDAWWDLVAATPGLFTAEQIDAVFGWTG